MHDNYLRVVHVHQRSQPAGSRTISVHNNGERNLAAAHPN